MNRFKKYFLINLLFFGLVWTMQAQPPAPAEKQNKPIALMNGTAHLGNGEVIENAIVTFEDGKITAVVDATNNRLNLESHQQIDVAGKHIYPGLIAANTIMGLEEIAAVRATRDQDETGMYNPNVRAIIAYNTDSEIIPTTRFNGILYAQSTPRGGRISGSSSVMDLDAWNWEDAVLKEDDGIHLNWPGKMLPPRWWRGETEWRDNNKYDEQYQEMEKFFEDANSYAKIKTPETVNLKLEAMSGLFNGQKNLYIHTSRPKEIIESVQFAQKQGVQKIVIVGAESAYYVREFLAENNIPVILEDTHRLPQVADQDFDMPYKLPMLLKKAGVKVVIAQWDEVMKVRNLPFGVGTAIAYGLTKEEALQMVSLNAAEVLGVDDKIGSLEEGKIASIVVSEGDIFDMKDNQLFKVFIEGRDVVLEAHQQNLYKKFKTKYERQEE